MLRKWPAGDRSSRFTARPLDGAAGHRAGTSRTREPGRPGSLIVFGPRRPPARRPRLRAGPRPPTMPGLSVSHGAETETNASRSPDLLRDASARVADVRAEHPGIAG